MAITTQIAGPLGLGEFLLRDWKSAGLIKPSAVKAAVSTIEGSLVRRRLGRLSDYDLAQLDKCLRSVLGL